MNKTWMVVHTIVAAAAVAVATFLTTQCGCSTTTRQTVIHDVGDVTSCIAPAIAALETCKASKGTTAQCAVAAVVELIACVTTAQQQPPVSPATKETSMIDDKDVMSIAQRTDNGVSGLRITGAVTIVTQAGGAIHCLTCIDGPLTGDLSAVYWDRNSNEFKTFDLAGWNIMPMSKPAPAPPWLPNTGHNPACSCVDCTQKRLAGQATNVAAPAPLPTGPSLQAELALGASAPMLSEPRDPGGEILATGGAYAGGLPSAEFPNEGTADSLTAYFEELRNMVETMNRRHEAMATAIARNTEVIDALMPTVNAHAGLLAEHRDELNRALKLDRAPHGAEAPTAGAPATPHVDSAG